MDIYFHIDLYDWVLISGKTQESNMFYINPYIATGQPVFSYIADTYGIIIEIIIYLILLIFSAYIIYRLEKIYIW